MQHILSPLITGPVLPFLRGHRQAGQAPTCGKGPAGGAAPKGPGPSGDKRCRWGDTKLRQRARGPGGAAGDSRAGPRGPWVADASARPAVAATSAGPEAVAPLPAPPSPGRTEPGDAAADVTVLPARTPALPALPPTPSSPVTHPGTGQQQRQQQKQPARHGEDSALAPGRPAPEGRCGRAGRGPGGGAATTARLRPGFSERRAD